MERIKVGLIGAGSMGKMHAEVFADLPMTELVAIADLNIERAEAVANLVGKKGKCYQNYKMIIDDNEIDAVVVATPDHLHKEPVISALQAGKHVLVEKPLATTLADCNEIVATAEKSGKVLMVNYTHRWAPPYAEAKNVIDSGKIGFPVMAYARKNDTINVITEWLPWLANSTPPAFLSSHDIDLIHWFFNSEAKVVYAQAFDNILKSKKINTLDAVQAFVRFENEAIATFESCWIYPNSFPTSTDSYIEIVFEKGVIHLDRKKEIMEVADESNFTYPKLSISHRVGGKLEGAFRSSILHFIDSIIENKKPLTSGEEARKVAEIVEAIHLSIKKGQPIFLPLGGNK